MEIWTSFKSTASKAIDVSGKVSRVKGVANSVKENGLGETAKNMISQKVRRAAAKRAMVAAKTIVRFLITPVWGWVVSGVIIVILLGAYSYFDESTSNLESVDGNVTYEQLAAMNNGCPVTPTSTGSVSGSIQLSAGKSNWSYSDVATFATSPLKSTWEISDDKAANYFLTGNQTVATKYGLNKNNIGEVTAVVKSAGVSPAFFYIYAVSEGGGFAGFINHYASDIPGGAVANAKRDAEYLVQTGNAVGLKPATIVGNVAREEVLRNMPTGPAEKLLAKMGDGTIGKVYIPSTAAVTAEIAHLSGEKGAWSPPGSGYGAPISELMTTITRLGGDVNSAEQIQIGGDSSNECEPEAGGGLVDGGMTFAEARKFMLEKYKNIPITMADIPGAAEGSPSIHDNCTAFVAFFIHTYTSLQTGGGNGVDVVDNLIKSNAGKLEKSNTPSVYSVFSLPNGGGPGLASGVEGHTGMVLGIDKDKGVAIIGQASYGSDAWASKFETMEIKLSQMTPENGWSFTDISKYIKNGNGVTK